MDLEVEVYSYSHRHINTWMTDPDVKTKCLFTGFYGLPEVQKRKEVWRLLASFKPTRGQGWCVMWDFNEMAINDEKEGGRPRKQIRWPTSERLWMLVSCMI